jgi:hypothetical protein
MVHPHHHVHVKASGAILQQRWQTFRQRIWNINRELALHGQQLADATSLCCGFTCGTGWEPHTQLSQGLHHGSMRLQHRSQMQS